MQDNEIIHAIYTDEDFTFCGLDFTGAVLEWVIEDIKVTCSGCISTGKVPKRVVGEI